MDIYQEIISALEPEDRVMLATIISTSGSTPAAALSKMIVKNNGTVSVGTIGGGCMEGEIILHANRLYNLGKAEILTFYLNEDDIEPACGGESGLICGGSLDVLIEPIEKSQIPLFQKIQSLVNDGEDCILGTLLSTDKKILSRVLFRRGIGVLSKGLLSEEGCPPEAPCLPAGRDQPSAESNGLMDKWNIEELLNYSTTPPKGSLRETTKLFHDSITPSLQQSISKSHHRNEITRLKLESGEIILEPINGTPSLIIFGGGHVSKFVSQTAVMAGFRVTIVDDRKKYANPQRFPEASRTLITDYTNAINQLTINQSTYIVIVTRGQKYDEIVLKQAIKTPAKYIGMIGSKKKVLTTYEHLCQGGITSEQLKRVHAPIGIDIGSVTAEEIAVSIIAELIRVRRGTKQLLQHMVESIR
ncbi:MAG: XdhC family protein [Ignavibacteriales bacterium]|nr:XdhC family protein [Ignavibacteriales bacterium]